MQTRFRLRTDRLAEEIVNSRRSQNAWAQVLGLSKGYLSQLVNGRRCYPSAAVRRRLLEALDLPFEALFVVESADPTLTQSRQHPRRRSRPLPGEAMSHLIQDLRYALRQFIRKPAFYGFAALILALGIGTNVTMFSAIRAILLRPLPLPEPDRLVRLFEHNEARGWGHSMVAPGNWQDWRSLNTSFSDIAVFLERDANLTGTGEAQRVRFTACSPNFFSVVGTPPLLGRGFAEEEGEPGREDVVVLSYTFWQNHLGGRADVLGHTVVLDGREATVVGVMPQGFSFPPQETDLWRPLALAPQEAVERGGHWLKALGRLAEGVSLQTAAEEMSSLAERLGNEYPETNEGFDVALEPLHEVETHGARTPLLLLWGSTTFILLIACVNVAHMLLVRSRERRGEMALRRTLGAGRGRLLRQLLTESMLLAALSAMGGLALAFLGLRIVPVLAAGSLPRAEALHLDLGAVLFTLALATFSGLAFGALPGLRADRGSLASSLAAGRTLFSGWGWRRAMIAGEVAIAVTVLVAAGLLVRSLWQVLQVDPGFAAEHLVSLRVEPSMSFKMVEDKPLAELFADLQAERARASGFYQELLERIEAIPGITAATAVNREPLSGSHWNFELEPLGRPASAGAPPASAQSRVVTPRYFRTAGIPLLAGRTLEPEDFHRRTGAVVIDQTLARRLWPREDPVGRELRYLGPPPELESYTQFKVVGVVGNVRQGSLEGSQTPTAYFPMPYAIDGHFEDWGMTLLVRSDESGLARVPQIRAALAELDPSLPIFAVRTMDDALGASVAGRRFQTLLLTGFGLLAVLLAALGVYAVVAYSVSQRRQEIGIRLALGAGRSRVLKQVLKEGMVPVGLGLAVGVLGAAVLSQLLSSLLYGVAPADPPAFLGGGAVLALAALVACAVPAWQATRVNPTSALKAD